MEIRRSVGAGKGAKNNLFSFLLSVLHLDCIEILEVISRMSYFFYILISSECLEPMVSHVGELGRGDEVFVISEAKKQGDLVSIRRPFFYGDREPRNFSPWCCMILTSTNYTSGKKLIS